MTIVDTYSPYQSSLVQNFFANSATPSNVFYHFLFCDPQQQQQLMGTFKKIFLMP